jgi:hypothetical protein
VAGCGVPLRIADLACQCWGWLIPRFTVAQSSSADVAFMPELDMEMIVGCFSISPMPQWHLVEDMIDMTRDTQGHLYHYTEPSH